MALIGGIVGGVAGLLLIASLIACILARTRRRKSAEKPQPAAGRNDESFVSARDSPAIYDSAWLNTTNNYDVGAMGGNNDNYELGKFDGCNNDDSFG